MSYSPFLTCCCFRSVPSSHACSIKHPWLVSPSLGVKCCSTAVAGFTLTLTWVAWISVLCSWSLLPCLTLTTCGSLTLGFWTAVAAVVVAQASEWHWVACLSCRHLLPCGSYLQMLVCLLPQCTCHIPSGSSALVVLYSKDICHRLLQSCTLLWLHYTSQRIMVGQGPLAVTTYKLLLLQFHCFWAFNDL